MAGLNNVAQRQVFQISMSSPAGEHNKLAISRAAAKPDSQSFTGQPVGGALAWWGT